VCCTVVLITVTYLASTKLLMYCQDSNVSYSHFTIIFMLEFFNVIIVSMQLKNMCTHL